MAGRPVHPDLTQAQLDALGDRMDKGFAEIKDMLKGFDERIRGLETREAGCQPLISARLGAAEKKLGSHDETLIRLTKVVDKLEGFARWLLGIVTALIIALTIAFFSGKIDIIFK